MPTRSPAGHTDPAAMLLAAGALLVGLTVRATTGSSVSTTGWPSGAAQAFIGREVDRRGAARTRIEVPVWVTARHRWFSRLAGIALSLPHVHTSSIRRCPALTRTRASPAIVRAVLLQQVVLRRDLRRDAVRAARARGSAGLFWKKGDEADRSTRLGPTIGAAALAAGRLARGGADAASRAATSIITPS